MILYHNADLKDLNSICECGLLPLSATGNNRWSSGKRAGNSADVVYLFKPMDGKSNSFPNYGIALIEVDADADKSEIDKADFYCGKYEEYTTAAVLPDRIAKIYIPEIFRHRIDLPESVLSKVVWCGIKANTYTPDLKYITADADILKRFADTAEMCVDKDNYFRGVYPNREVIDLYDIEYII